MKERPKAFIHIFNYLLWISHPLKRFTDVFPGFGCDILYASKAKKIWQPHAMQRLTAVIFYFIVYDVLTLNKINE